MLIMHIINIKLQFFCKKSEFPKSSSGARVLGAFSSKNTRETNVQYGRQGGDLLNAFKNNPYTHSLTNVV